MERIASTFGNRRFNGALLIAVSVLSTALGYADAESEGSQAVVRHRGVPVVTFTGAIRGDYLVVEAELTPNWHIYAMDNRERARDRTGKESPECELPTRISVQGPVELTGPWRQSAPADLSNPEIYWYTWGFEDRAVFAAPVQITGEGAVTVTVNGQACSASSCSMIQDVMLTIAPTKAETGTEAIFDALVPLIGANAGGETGQPG